MDLSKLKEPFDPKLIDWRVGATNVDAKTGQIKWGDKPMGVPLAFLDARDVMDRLDAVCGPENWQNLHPHANGKTSCKIGIKIGNEWVWKENGAGDTDFEADKGAFSTAFKRAAVLWGIGRYLYDVQNFWIEIERKGRSYVIKDLTDSRLIGALEKAAAGIRATPASEPRKKEPDKPKDDDAEKRKKALAWASRQESDIKAFTVPSELEDWYDDNKDLLDGLEQRHKDLFDALMITYNKQIDEIGA